MKIRNPLGSLALCAFAAALTACGGGTNASQGSPGSVSEKGGVTGTSGRSVNVCAMVPKEEVSQVIGARIMEVTDTRDACEYHTGDPAVMVTINVNRGRFAGAAMEGAKSASGIMSSGDNAKPPAEFGDNAIYGANDSLAFLKNGVFVNVMPPFAAVRSAENPAPDFLSVERKREIAAALAKKVLERMR